MPRLTVRRSDHPVPGSYGGMPTEVIPISALAPGRCVFVHGKGVINGFTQVRSVKRHGQSVTVKTDYGDAVAEAGQAVRVLSEKGKG